MIDPKLYEKEMINKINSATDDEVRITFMRYHPLASKVRGRFNRDERADKVIISEKDKIADIMDRRLSKSKTFNIERAHSSKAIIIKNEDMEKRSFKKKLTTIRLSSGTVKIERAAHYPDSVSLSNVVAHNKSSGSKRRPLYQGASAKRRKNEMQIKEKPVRSYRFR